jgi:hypothetical protein
MDSTLLCTFSHNTDINIIVDYIFKNYTLERGSVFLFQNQDDPDEMFCTYNVVTVDHYADSTIMIHRKKESNTLYTINALNDIIRQYTGGVLDKNYKLDWSLYQNSMLLSVNQSVRIVPLELKSVIRR